MFNIDKYKDIPFEKRKNCMICNNSLAESIIKLPNFPLTEVYVRERIIEKIGFVDQEFCLCDNCGHGQIMNIIDPRYLYEDTYSTRTSTSSSAIEAIDVFLEFMNKSIKNRRINNIIDIGCNDVYTLNRLKTRASKLYGIDPILKGREGEYEQDNIFLIGDFIENINLADIGIELDVVLCSHTLEHIGDPKKLIKKLIDNANEKTVFFFQFPGFEGLVKDANFDQIFHQHYNYFTLKSIIYMLEDLGAELIDYQVNPYHWETLMISFQKKSKESINSFEKYANSIKSLKREEILSQFRIFKACMQVTSDRLKALKEERIYGFGAALMLPVLHYHLENGLSNLMYILDEDSNKIGKYYLNVPIKIIHPNDIKDIKDSIIVLTAINSLKAGRQIIPKLMKLNVKQIIVPTNSI